MKNVKKEAILPAALVLVLFVGLFVLERVVPASSILFVVLKKGAIYALVAASMNLLNGFTGLFSLGQAGFMLIGAYTYAIFTIPVEMKPVVYQYYDHAIGFTLPVLKLKSDYLAIATLGFAEIIRAVIQYEKLGPITNGSNMLKSYPKFNSVLFPFAVAGVCIAVILLLINSSYGRAFKAIRDDEIAAEAMGVNLFKHKEMAFTISSFFAGISGALLAMFQSTVQASAFKSSMTYEILLIVVIGGIGSISGSVIASFLFVACSEWWLRFLDTELYFGSFQIPFLRSGFRMVVFSVVIMIMVLFYRRGIMGDRELFQKRREKKKGEVQQ